MDIKTFISKFLVSTSPLLASEKALRVRNHQRGPGAKTVLRPKAPGKYDGAALKAIRAQKGVGRPPKVAA